MKEDSENHMAVHYCIESIIDTLKNIEQLAEQDPAVASVYRRLEMIDSDLLLMEERMDKRVSKKVLESIPII